MMRWDASEETSDDVGSREPNFVPREDKPMTASVRSAIQRVYNATLRDRLPKRWGVFNEVAVREVGCLDFTSHEPDYEFALVDAICEAVEPDDHACIVGGGYGVSTVWASRRAGPAGHVDVYEGAGEQVARVRETVRVNDTPAPVEVHHAIVGPAIDLWGDGSDADHMAGEHLPDADVLVLDAEGAEDDILDRLPHRPREIVVEYHNQFDTSRQSVVSRLDGYDVVSHAMEDVEVGVGIIHARRPE